MSQSEPVAAARNLTVEDALPFLAEIAEGTTLAADLSDPRDRKRVKQIVYRYIAAGILPAVHLGRRVYLQPEQVAEWMRKGGSSYKAPKLGRSRHPIDTT